MASILCVDDCEIFRSIVFEFLAEEGHVVSVAANAKDAIITASKIDFDMIIVDLDMPTVNGLQLTEYFRSTRQYATKPILILSSLETLELKVSGKAVGANGWLSKTSARETITSAVNRLSRCWLVVNNSSQSAVGKHSFNVL